MREKRKQQRVEVEVRITAKDNRISGLTKNISRGGCFLKKSEDFHLLPIGSTIPFYIEIPGGYAYIEIDGVITHHGQEGDGMGIRFESAHRGIPSLIDQFLRDYSP